MLGDNVSTPDTDENEYRHIIENDMEEGNELLKRLIDKYEKAKITPIGYRQRFKKPHKKDEKKLVKATVDVNNLLETMPLQFEDLTQLNDFAYSCAQLSIEIADRKQMSRKKQTKATERKR